MAFNRIFHRLARLSSLALPLFLTTTLTHAEGHLLKIPTRPDITTTLFWEPHEGAKTTVFLFPGGGGGFGKVEDGRPTSRNFLVRTVPEFLANGFNVAIFGKPSDTDKLDYPDRISEAHIADIRAALDFVKKQNAAPIWLIGTSRGTISATAAAINIHDPGIAGLVLTSSVVSDRKVGAVPTQDLAAIKMPVLVMHHTNDACNVCSPSGVPAIMSGLKNAPVKKEIMVSGGGNPTGNPCEALHWHGFIGMEKEAVDTISEWIKQASTP
jgi:predicted alpha/beta-hydrolase family hydrolase